MILPENCGAHIGARDGIEGRASRIVDRDWIAGRDGQHGGKIALPLGHGGDGVLLGRRWLVLDLFPIDKEEGMVSSVVDLGKPDRAAELGAEFIVLIEGDLRPLR